MGSEVETTPPTKCLQYVKEYLVFVLRLDRVPSPLDFVLADVLDHPKPPRRQGLRPGVVGLLYTVTDTPEHGTGPETCIVLTPTTTERNKT